MAGTLFGEIVNSCDAVTGFSAGNISGDDDFAEGTGALGAKVSNTYTEFYTTSLGAGAPYDFSVGGVEDGQHFIMWFSSKSKLSATSGYRLIMGNGTDRAEWDVPPLTSELKRNGAFVTRVIDPAQDFSRITTGTWTTTGNPAQLTSVTQMGGGLQTTVSIMGSFNNAQIDQMTIGWGIRLSGGTVGTPDSFEVARAADEDSGIWGWSQETVLKGGIYIGPATGTAASVFVSENETRVFAASPVATGFYRIEARGAGTDVTITGANISAKDSSVARWDYTVGSDTNSWSDTDSVYSGIDAMTLQASATLSGLTVRDTNTVTQNGADVSGSRFSELTNAFDMDDYSLVTNTQFNNNTTAIDATNAIISDAVDLDGLTFSGNTTDVTVNSANNITINNLNGSNATTCTNTGAGTCTIVTALTYEITGLDAGSVVTIVDLDNSNTELFNETAGVDGIVTYSFDGADSGKNIGVYIRNTTIRNNEFDDVLPSVNVSFPVSQISDTVYI